VSQPQPYTPSHIFLTDQALQSWFPGSELDVEFNNLRSTTDQVRNNLALIQRDDGMLANGIVDFNSLSTSLQTNGLAPFTGWVTGTNYSIGQIVFVNPSFYYCAVAHTSGTFSADLAAGKWTLLVTFPSLQFTQTGTGAVQRTVDAKLKDSVWVSVTDFSGVDPTGVADSTTGIQNAINAMPAGGGTLFFPPGTYKISSTLTVGNGSTSGQSTQAGVYLVGSGSTQGSGTTFVWGGGATSASMLVFLGPMKGWGVSKILFNGNSLAGGALKLVAASNGQFDHSAIVNCTNQNIILASLTASPTGNANCQFNTFNDFQVFVTAVANTMAILLDGNGVNSATNSSLNTFNNGSIVFPTSSTAMFGVYLRDTDGNLFNNLILFGGGSGTAAVTFDYGGSSAGTWPANNTFVGFDPDGNTPSAVKYLNSGSPSSAARPNRFFGVIDGNSAPYPKLLNTTYAPEFISPGISLTGQIATLAATNVNGSIPLYVAGMYRVSYGIQVTTVGSGGTLQVAITWTDATGTHSNVSLGSAISLTALSSNSSTFPIMALAATNVQMSVTLSGATGNPQFAFFAKLEKMD
jgi:Pectate lyase superfamily protein